MDILNACLTQPYSFKRLGALSTNLFTNWDAQTSLRLKAWSTCSHHLSCCIINAKSMLKRFIVLGFPLAKYQFCIFIKQYYIACFINGKLTLPLMPYKKCKTQQLALALQGWSLHPPVLPVLAANPCSLELL